MAGETHATHAAPEAGGHKVFPPFEPASFAGQLVWFAIAFGLLYAVMSRIALPKVGAILEDRRRRIAADLDEAHAMRTRSEEAEAEYQRALADARNRSKSIAQEMRDKLAGESDTRRKALEADLAAKLATAEGTIRSRTDAAMANVRDVASDAATAIVERLTGRVPDGAALSSALDRALRN